jgi:phage tail sheath gpL-like
MSEYTREDFAYALAQLTDDCELEWIRTITGLSWDECDEIWRICHAAQSVTFDKP